MKTESYETKARKKVNKMEVGVTLVNTAIM